MALQVHCPSPNNLPSNLYHLKKALNEFNECTIYHYCSNCHEMQLDKGGKKCSNRRCKGTICDLLVLPIEKRLKQLYGKRQLLS